MRKLGLGVLMFASVAHAEIKCDLVAADMELPPSMVDALELEPGELEVECINSAVVTKSAVYEMGIDLRSGIVGRMINQDNSSVRVAYRLFMDPAYTRMWTNEEPFVKQVPVTIEAGGSVRKVHQVYVRLMGGDPASGRYEHNIRVRVDTK